MRMKFTDGMSIETSGPYRIIKKSDGYYVVGHGMCCPVDSPMDGDALIKELMSALPPDVEFKQL